MLDITNARHPTVEYSLMTSPAARPFVPNDLRIDPTSAPVHVITGPNMGGKSTVLRQAAIVVILAQAGSFVPADEARVGVVDAVFSRVGARDDLVRDMSTFMLEMHE
jgi:DNA mismatch repair ATPase MutS